MVRVDGWDAEGAEDWSCHVMVALHSIASYNTYTYYTSVPHTTLLQVLRPAFRCQMTAGNGDRDLTPVASGDVQNLLRAIEAHHLTITADRKHLLQATVESTAESTPG